MNHWFTSGTSQARRVRPDRRLKGRGAHSSEMPEAVVSAAARVERQQVRAPSQWPQLGCCVGLSKGKRRMLPAGCLVLHSPFLHSTLHALTGVQWRARQEGLQPLGQDKLVLAFLLLVLAPAPARNST